MTTSPIRLVDETGIERFRGTQSPGGGSSPGLRVVQASFSWAELDAQDPGVGVTLATLAATEQLAGLTVAIVAPLTGTDAAVSDGYVSVPGKLVSENVALFVNPGTPLNYVGGDSFSTATGAVVGAFALDADPTQAADLTGGTVNVALLILSA